MTDCCLPTVEILQDLPFVVEPYRMPEEIDLVLKRDRIDDDVMELCMQETLIKGNILTNFQEQESNVCVPKQVVDEMYCPGHEHIKPHWGLLLTSFHKYPRIIRWKEGKKWLGNNSFKFENALNKKPSLE